MLEHGQNSIAYARVRYSLPVLAHKPGAEWLHWFITPMYYLILS